MRPLQDAIVYPVSYGGFRNTPGVLGVPQPRISLPGGITIGGSRGPVGTGGSTAADYARGDAYLGELALRTGGRLYRGNSVINISQAFAWVAEELRRQYSLGYYPKATGKNGERRRIKVEVSRPELVVQARNGYVYSEPKEAEAQP